MPSIIPFPKKFLVPSLLALSSMIMPSAFADTYEGNRDADNRFHGKGVYTYSGGGVYEGTWDHGERIGSGKHTWIDGTVYDGEWENNLPQGNGVKTYSDGSQYIGEFQQGERSKIGTMKWNNGDIYKGQWTNDQPNGDGQMQFASGASYIGQFVLGQQSGEGVYTYADTSRYHGTWEDNKPQGTGTLTLLSGDKYTGSFEEGHPQGFGEFFYANGDTYTGQWKNGKRTGKGLIEYKAGGSYEGYFKKGKRAGYGTLVFAKGDKFTGPFENDLAHGKGTCKIQGTRSSCEYDNGVKVTPAAIEIAIDNESENPVASTLSVSAIATTASIASTAAALTTSSLPVTGAMTTADTPATSPSWGKTVTAVIPTTPVVEAEAVTDTLSAKDVFKNTLKNDLKTLSKTYSLADIPLNTSDVLFNHNFAMDLMAKPEHALWKKRNALISDTLRIESKHGMVSIIIEVENYRGPGSYTIVDRHVRVHHKDKVKYQASTLKPSVIVIKSDDNQWISGTFDLALFDNKATKPAREIENGVFRLSKHSAIPYQTWQ